MSETDNLAALQERIGVAFRDTALLEQALRHRSAAIDQAQDSNERMEFLGDSILGMIVCEYLYSHFPEASEGDLAKAKAYLVSEPTLAEIGLELGLGEAVSLSGAEEASGGRQRRSILSDTVEALIAAVFLDQGVRSARRVVRQALRGAMKRVAKDDYQRDFKSALQERLQADVRKTPRYRIASESGADHDKTFHAVALLGNDVIGEGEGKSKKEAQQAAARNALDLLRQETEPEARG